MTRVLITGGAWFIGAKIVAAAIEVGLEPVVLDHREPVHTEVELVAGDVRDADAELLAIAG
jgi:nucleoside-diphosphate-sugar epimerase